MGEVAKNGTYECVLALIMLAWFFPPLPETNKG